MKSINQSVSLLLFGFFIMAAIFVIDVNLPLGVAGGVPYAAVILIALWFRNNKYVILFAFICSMLTLVGFYFSPQEGELWKVVTNRVLALFVIWVTALLAIKWAASQERMLKIKYEAEIENKKKEIYLATMHSALHVTNNLLNQLKLVELEILNHRDFNKDVYAMFDGMMSETDSLIKELSSVKEIDPDVIRKSVYPKNNA
ncbi:hypothetical protein BOW53_16455 [Solemya pervernicosa gill symbiont]|uniref:Histidine kinase n=2 Tax=Gammaproteobacteria incertae sedis TaxID=118884 RepID=A0A1T2KZ79_9GAMM|nr:hypothetical protein [Candidatus Reidiella endopervernicosa]OOZ38143.1 hypothetical protein BOW53_16455 [Solemya pervernicosa gill symbiont]QKQ26549.1 hypothetical protein HUE57_09845 [Candidatus Reidiella endopervernicosa]